MADDTLVLTCKVADFDATTGVCAAPFYSSASAFPTMSLDDAQAIGLSIALLWATAFGLRMCRVALQKIG